VVVRASAGVSMHTAAHGHTGTLAYVHRPEPVPNQFHIDGTDAYPPLVLEWDMKALTRRPLCFRATPETHAFVPGNVVNGFARPYGGPNLWASAPLVQESEGQAWLELAWDGERDIREVLLTFNDDVNEHLNNLHKFETPFRVFRELVRDYRIEARVGGQWNQLCRETGNRTRRRRHRWSEPVRATALRLVVEATNGAPCAEVFEIRAYQN